MLTCFEDRITPAHTYTITTTGTSRDFSKLTFDGNGNASNTDGSPVTLYEALMAMHQSDANGTGYLYPGPNVIEFNLPGTGVHTFPFVDASGETQSDDPRWQILQDNTTIDGWSQPGSSPNNANPGDPINAQVRIELPFRIGVRSSNNLIRGLSFRGVDMWDKLTPWGSNQDALNNTIEGNFLGLKADGKTTWGDRQAGVYIGKYKFTSADARNQSNTIGGILPSTANLIAGHAGANPTFGAADGVLITDGSHNNLIVGNYIGTNKDLGKAANALSGVYVDGTSYSNTVQDNIISFNGDYGVRLDGGRFTTLTSNRMSANTKGGIFQAAGANDDVPAPALTGMTSTDVSGTLAGASAVTPFTVEFFTSASKDPAGAVEGQKSLGTVTVTTTPFTASVAGLTAFVTATATDVNGNTSVFSNALGTGGGGDVGIKSVIPKLDSEAAPGESNVVKITVENKSTDKLTANGGTALVKLYTGPDKKYLLAEYDVPLGSKLELKPKQSKTFTLKFKFPDIGDPNQIDPGTYEYYVELDPAWKGKTGTSASTFDFVYQFGTVGERKNVKVTIRQPSSAPGLNGIAYAAAGGEVTLAVKGPGTGTVTVNGTDTDLSFAGTTTDSKVTAKIVGGSIGKVHNISMLADIGIVDLSNLDADGAVTSSAALKELKLHDFGGSGSNLALTSGSLDPATLTFHQVHDTTIASDRGIEQFTAIDWISTGGTNSLVAPYIDQLDITGTKGVGGEFAADIDILTADPNVTGLSKVSIAGTVHDSNWDIGGYAAGLPAIAIGRLDVGDSHNWSLKAKGGIYQMTVVGNLDSPSLVGPTLQATVFGSIDIGGDINTTGIQATAVDAKTNIAISKLQAKTVTKLDTLVADQGGIKSIVVDGWNAPTGVLTPWMQSIKTDIGDFSANLTLTGTEPGTTLSLTDVEVKGALDGTWDVFADVTSIEASDAPSFFFNGGQGGAGAGTFLELLRIHNKSLPVLGTVRTEAIGKVLIDGDFKGTLESTLPIPITSITLGNMSGTIQTPGAIGKVTVGTWVKGTSGAATITAGEVKHLLILGKAENGTFNLNGGAASFIVGSMTDCTVNAAGQNIGVFKVRGIKGDPTPYFTNTNVTAEILGLVLLNDVDASPAPVSPYGITADFVIAYSRFVGGKAVQFTQNGKKTNVLHFPAAGIGDQAGKYSLTINDGGKPPA
ncbi:MAG TPA: right-handed parallel beta-helix repeat-containing protein [Gemmataceae bacterium]|jgi:parallel beta-helix repeat protein|nr:right-handed parallel beta-helix repeat-containing protein [Gemmataceae bacterium]